MRRGLLAIAVLLSACGSTPEPAPVPVDEAMQREARSGLLAYSLERPAEAATHYDAALKRAQIRDDAAAIADLGYNLAVAALRAGDTARALAAARDTREELARRGEQPFPALLLVEATALYRLGSAAEADGLAALVQTGGDPQAAAGASFLRGLIADESGDEAGLAAAAGALAAAPQPGADADALELAARLALQREALADAAGTAARAAALRRDVLDYRGLARALALQGEATRRAGNPAKAADLFLRAGRSAALQEDTGHARRWLEQVIALAPGTGAAGDARRLLATLAKDQE